MFAFSSIPMNRHKLSALYHWILEYFKNTDGITCVLEHLKFGSPNPDVLENNHFRKNVFK
jgi:hypothetical protein